MFLTVLFNGIYGDAKEIAVAWPWTPKRPLTYLNNKQTWVLPNEPDITHSNPNTLPIPQREKVHSMIRINIYPDEKMLCYVMLKNVQTENPL